MKKIKIIQIIELCILIVIAIGLISFLRDISKNRISQDDRNSFSFDLNWGNRERKDFKKSKEEQVSSKGIKKIELDFGMADLEVTVTEEEVIRIVETSTRNLREDELFTLTNENGILKVTRGKFYRGLIFSFSGIGYKVQLFIPKNYSGDLSMYTGSGDISILSNLNLREVAISAGSGDLQIDSDLQAQSFKGELASGDIDVSRIDAKDYTLTTASGDIAVNYLKGSGSVKASSGDITIDELAGGKYTVKSASGDISVNNIEGTGEISASSGGIDATYRSINEYTKLSTASGDIDVNLAENISFEMDAKCMSGEVEGNIPMDYKGKHQREAEAKVGKEPYAKLTISASSGDITVNQ